MPALASKLQYAFEHREFELHYQPKFHLASGALQGVEALIRWRTAAGQWVPPTEFMPVMERTGLIDQVGTWLFERAAADSEFWRRSGHTAVRIAINISPLQLQQRDFLSAVLLAAGDWKRRGVALDLELTESAAIPDSDELVGEFNELSTADVSLALDDFGTGYSSLQLLTRLPVRYLKIDRSFIAQLGSPGKATAIVESIVRLARELGIETIAEGVETTQQFDRLQGMGCDIGQGFLLGTAVSREDLLSRLPRLGAGSRSPFVVDT